MICRKCGAELPSNALYCFLCGKAVNNTTSKRRRGNGEGCAYKRGSTWTGQAPGYSFVDKDGVMHRVRPRKGGFKTKKEALQWAMSETANEKPLPKLIDLWQGYSENDMLKLSASKQGAYRIARKRIESIMSRRIDTLSIDDLQKVVNAECKTYYPAKDVRDLLSNLYQRAMASNSNKGRVTQNLAKFIVLPDLEEKDAEPFTEEEVQKLWAAYSNGDRFVGYILLLCYTGMMPSELMSCKKDMVNLDACEIRGAGAKTTARKRAAIVFPTFVKPVIEDLLSIHVENVNTKNDKLLTMNKDSFYKAYYAALERAEVRPLPPYSCRHTYGTNAVKLGVHPAIVQKMLRHSNQKTQERYTHLSDSDVHEAAEKMAK